MYHDIPKAMRQVKYFLLCVCISICVFVVHLLQVVLCHQSFKCFYVFTITSISVKTVMPLNHICDVNAICAFPLFLGKQMYLSLSLIQYCSCVSLQDSWEIVEGLRGAPASMQEPDRQEGFVLKRRKWPMKGWHKVSTSPALLEAQTATALKHFLL